MCVCGCVRFHGVCARLRAKYVCVWVCDVSWCVHMYDKCCAVCIVCLCMVCVCCGVCVVVCCWCPCHGCMKVNRTCSGLVQAAQRWAVCGHHNDWMCVGVFVQGPRNILLSFCPAVIQQCVCVCVCVCVCEREREGETGDVCVSSLAPLL